MLDRWLEKKISESVDDLLKEKGVNQSSLDILPKGVRIEFPKKAGFGDLASPVAMHLATSLKMAPRAIAIELQKKLSALQEITQIEVAGPGYLNITFTLEFLHECLKNLLDTDRSPVTPVTSPKKILIEYVSANPTGPLHVGHGRGAAYGNSIARILKILGHEVTSEYYINNAGNQMDLLARSTYLAWRALQGDLSDEEKTRILPDGSSYQGSYVTEIAREIADNPNLLSEEEREHAQAGMDHSAGFLTRFSEIAEDRIMEGIRKDLMRFGIGFDRYFSEKTLHAADPVEGKTAIDRCLDEIRNFSNASSSTGLADIPDLFEEEGALWLRTTRLGDDKDRVLRKSDGNLTYYAADIAYHREKISRGHDLFIDVWGADHHGYILRMQAAMKTLNALNGTNAELKVALIQLVNLLREGKPVGMSKRSGDFVTLSDVLDEVGVDATRFLYLTRSHESSLDFDLEIAKSKSMDNPVYYVQYAHARVCNLLKQAEIRGIRVPARWTLEHLSPLVGADEKTLIMLLDRFDLVVSECGSMMEVHPLTDYLTELAGQFHRYYFHNRILSPESGGEALILARLALSSAVGRIIQLGLSLLGVSAPESM
ncbi:arginine--tRNA ligase [Leptospirillum ferrooxidans]|uniref:Arginine--tRNA ligase n=1 Tax=Leptospirillum ferrooxidans (strain C2-3) TaxID=1162668 RepID=I0INR1_LEPFC|nr:arginine--tRNA ligase [Leptospirillum ferrooxidans]BAM06910.1 putative Arginyl-tRNA synthetase [Leptospirillum ferrooxidans C2-3]